MNEMSLTEPAKPLFQVRVTSGNSSGGTSIPCNKDTRKAMVEYRKRYEATYGEQKNWDAILLALIRVPLSFVGMR
ncbi:hypothetical protein M0R72_05990 [Candidatus Pacearchaeota archaeon]|jgi:hypothetical protein|nr:hypothetical protein [Candidatus Pacearchaeota archaeon]